MAARQIATVAVEFMRFATLNLWGPRSPYSVRIEAIGREVLRRKIDLLLLQEVYDSPAVGNSAVTIARMANLKYVYFAPTLTKGEKKWGNAIVSRTPITRRLATPLSAGRWAMSGTVDGIAVHNTHLSYKVEDQDLRISQVKKILNLVENYGGDRVILGGDFNATPESKEIQIVTRTFTDLGVSLPATWSLRNDHTGEQWAIDAQLPRDRRIDYLFVDGVKASSVRLAFDSRTADGQFPSDHFGVVADLGSKEKSIWPIVLGLSFGAIVIVSLSKKRKRNLSDLGIVDKIWRPETGRREWVLLSRKTQRPLKWFGPRKPSRSAIDQEERRVQFFKRRKP